MKTKYHGVTVKLIRPTEGSVMMDISHADYGVIPGVFVPKSVIDEESLAEIEEHADGDELDIYIAAWWFRKNYGEVR